MAPRDGLCGGRSGGKWSVGAAKCRAPAAPRRHARLLEGCPNQRFSWRGCRVASSLLDDATGGKFARRGWRGLDMAAHAVARDVCAAGRPGAVVSRGAVMVMSALACCFRFVVGGLGVTAGGCASGNVAVWVGVRWV